MISKAVNPYFFAGRLQEKTIEKRNNRSRQQLCLYISLSIRDIKEEDSVYTPMSIAVQWLRHTCSNGAAWQAENRSYALRATAAFK
jgi:hypothetical protein